MVGALSSSSSAQSVKKKKEKARAGSLKLFSGILNNIILKLIMMWPEVTAITTNAVSSIVNILSVVLCYWNALGEPFLLWFSFL